jgi:inner membrane protein
MPTYGHIVAGLALGTAFETERWPRRRAYLVGAICSVVPDLDVLGLHMHIPYASTYGHRGFSHSLLAAAVVGLLALVLGFRKEHRSWSLACYLIIVSASHGLLDACSSGGLGIAFFAPFDNTRYFLPWRPIQAAPLVITRTLLHHFWTAFSSEMKWILLPSILFSLACLALKGRFRRTGDKQAA